MNTQKSKDWIWLASLWQKELPKDLPCPQPPFVVGVFCNLHALIFLL